VTVEDCFTDATVQYRPDYLNNEMAATDDSSAISRDGQEMGDFAFFVEKTLSM
jgi:hypothetical protein